ncbi:MAG: thiamine pyrophosphate-binding protein, partial [Alphaproteobacteria bacterium]|nr:thiamine pyrophosphate-binding protein [Alphaproteobacteria bacterium]
MDDPSATPVQAAGNEIDRPVPGEPSARVWGSDAIAAMLRDLDLPYVALNPGSSYRGLHDSIVNYLGNTRPRMLLCLHEESAVALAHGYAKVTGRPIAAIVHANVGLMHATMAVFNAWCDRAPIILLGATGAVDAMRRRPWIEWIHTARDQGALIRNYTKWDDQPASIGAAQEAILRANMIAQTAPCGPVYVNLNLELQEDEIAALPPRPQPGRFTPPPPLEPAGPPLHQAAEL